MSSEVLDFVLRFKGNRTIFALADYCSALKQIVECFSVENGKLVSAGINEAGLTV